MTNELLYNEARKELRDLSLEELKENFDLDRNYSVSDMSFVTNPIEHQRSRAAQDLAAEKGYDFHARE